MKRNKWQRRLLSCFLAFAVLLGCFLGCLPLRAGAIVPLGLVQSALASFVTSAGYKMWSDNNGGEVMVEALSTLYQSWLDSTDPVGALTLGQMSENDYVYLDNSGQIVIRKAAADMFQQFSDWIQSEYSVPLGSSTPTDVISGSGGILSNSAGTISALKFSCNKPFSVDGTSGYYCNIAGTVLISGTTYTCYVGASDPCDLYMTSYSGGYWNAVNGASTYYFYYLSDRNGSGISHIEGQASSTGDTFFRWGSLNKYYFPGVPASTASPRVLSDLTVSSGGVAGLGVTLAQAVADVVGLATDDDAVVIGVGAGVGATAQDIADLVAQGVKAQTLEPSVSITAEAVIDTPVQPYPDIDGLGLPTLGAALVSRFPFCVPWDFVDTLKILNANPTPPVFDVTLVPASVAARWGVSGNYTLHVDLTAPEYAKLFVALRWGTLVGFCLGLAFLTKRLIWTA